MEIFGYIYKITNLVNQKVYIGQTTRKYPNIRWGRHKYDAKTLDTPLYRAIRKYGEDNFQFSVLFACDSRFQLDEAEKHIIAAYKATDRNIGYNLSEGGGGTSGVPCSEERKQKISKSQLGKVISPETREKLRRANLGKKASLETRKKLSKPKHSEEHKKKLSERMKGNQHTKGHTLSEEHRRKIGEKSKGNKHNVGRTPWNKGTKCETSRSEEVRKRISETLKETLRLKKLKEA